MMQTEHMALNKPEETDYYNVEDFNQNADILDSKIKEMGEDIEKRLEKNGDSKNNTVTFSLPEERENIMQGENHRTLFGKIARWFTDLKRVAFTGSYNDLSDVPEIPVAVRVKGNAEKEYRTGDVNITPKSIGLENVNNTADADKSVKKAESAIKAIQDGNGNVITDTYLQLSGGTITGKVYINNSSAGGGLVLNTKKDCVDVLMRIKAPSTVTQHSVDGGIYEWVNGGTTGDGSMVILPYGQDLPITKAFQNKNIGLYIEKGVIKIDGEELAKKNDCPENWKVAPNVGFTINSGIANETTSTLRYIKQNYEPFKTARELYLPAFCSRGSCAYIVRTPIGAASASFNSTMSTANGVYKLSYNIQVDFNTGTISVHCTDNTWGMENVPLTIPANCILYR